MGNRVWGNETVMTYLKTGLYRYWLPPAGRIKWKVRIPSALLPCMISWARPEVDWCRFSLGHYLQRAPRTANL